METLIILAITIFVIWYMYASRYRNYWKSQGVPYEKLSLFFGLTLQRYIKPFHLVDQELYRKHGRLFGVFEDGRPALYVSDPDLLKLILVADYEDSERKTGVSCDDSLFDNMVAIAPSEKWRRIRAAITPLFTASKLRKMHNLVQELAIVPTEALIKAAREGADVDPTRLYFPTASNVLSRCTFGKEIDCGNDASIDIIHALYVPISFSLIVSLRTFMEKVRSKFIRNKAFYFYKELCLNIVKKKQLDTNKALDVLKPPFDIKNHPASHKEKPITPFLAGLTKKLSEEEAMAQCILFHVAGVEAISGIAALVSYYLAVHPDMQAKLRDEADDCFAKHGRFPSYDVVSKLEYLDAVVLETLRICPPFTRLERTFNKDYVIGNTDIKVPKDSVITVPIYAMHHDPDFYPNPESFMPERFLEGNASEINPYTYFPFGYGPRNCVAQTFGLQVIKTILLHAVHEIQFVKTQKTKVPLDMRTGYGMLIPTDLIVGIRTRN
uniref:Putative cytochrome n=1 Tax=Ixodes scapularis TaxID=6945 RepID=A0A4D5RI36_IXOSC